MYRPYPVIADNASSEEWQDVLTDEIPSIFSSVWTNLTGSRMSTNGSNTIPLESSWEEVQSSAVLSTFNPRKSSGVSGNPSTKKGRGLKLKLASFLKPHSKDLYECHTGDAPTLIRPHAAEMDDGRIPMMDSINGVNVYIEKQPSASLPVIIRDDASGAIAIGSVPPRQLEPKGYSKSAHVRRFHMSNSEGDTMSFQGQAQIKSRSSSSNGSSPLMRSGASLTASQRELPGTKRNHRRAPFKQSRSIGIITGEDFVMNPTSGDKLVSHLNSVWNNIKYGWNVKPRVHLSLKSPVWIFGQCYTVGISKSEREKSSVYEAFLKDFRTRLWFTYRRDFPTLVGSTLTSDCGWGCMLRSGQMMLAQALVLHFLSRDWRWDETHKFHREKDVFHRQIIRWCGDTSSPHDQLFGLHKLVTVGQKCGKQAGDWYGPGSMAHILQKAVDVAAAANPLLKDVQIYVAQDSTIFKGDIVELRRSRASDRDIALIILIPVRLGGDHVNPVYMSCVKDFLTLKYSIGIIGGRPRHSLYFLGWQDNSLIHLDPHFCQDTVDVAQRNFRLNSFHCSSPRKLSMKSMDPSCTLGFYCCNLADYEEFVEILTEVQKRHCKEYPIFSFSEGKLSDYDRDGLDLTSFEAEHHVGSAVLQRVSEAVDVAESYDFVVL